jgi:large subunit ribosomal protein L24
MARHVKKGDTVVVLAGDDRGKVGQVLRVDPGKGKVLVQGINRVYKHLKPSRRHPRGGRIQKEMPVHLSNVLPVDPKTNQPTRVRFALAPGGAKERLAKKSGTSLGVLRKSR